MNIAAYCRVSTDKADQLNSLEAQKEFFSEYTKRTGDTLVRLYADEGISGTKIKNRKEFLSMMADAEHGLFEMVVVKDISRFARNTVDCLSCIQRLKERNIAIYFEKEHINTLEATGELLITILSSQAQEESRNISENVKWGLKRKYENGEVLIKRTFGYEKGIDKHLHIIPEEAEIVRMIYKEYLEGKSLEWYC